MPTPDKEQSTGVVADDGTGTEDAVRAQLTVGFTRGSTLRDYVLQSPVLARSPAN
jgi:hypothetical protein